MQDSHDSRRKLFMHSAHRSIGVGAPLVTRRAERALRACLLARPFDDDAEELLDVLEVYLSEQRGVECTRVLSAGGDWLLPQDLASFDCLVLPGGGLTIAGPQGAGSDWPKYVPDTPPEDDVPRGASGRVQPIEAASGHPVLAGVEPFLARWRSRPLSGVDMAGAALLSADFNGDPLPVAWAHADGGVRVFRTMLACPANAHEANFLRLCGNAVCWATEPDR